MLELGTSTVMFLLGLVVGIVLAAPKLREAMDSLSTQAASYILLGVALFVSVVVAGWIGLTAVAVAYLLYVVFGLRDIRILDHVLKREQAAQVVQRNANERAASDDDLIVKLVTDWDATDEGDGATSQGIRELAMERNVAVPPGSLDRLVAAGRLQKLESGRYRTVGFSDENTDADAPLAEDAA